MKRSTSIFIIFLFVPLLSYAHGSHGSGFVAGFTHPIFGLDHSIAIVGTALLGCLLNRDKWYLYSLSFLVFMIIGGIIGIGKESTYLIETAIALSSILIGLRLVFDFHINKIVVLGVLAIFGFYHGYAHGAEMPLETGPIKYISGFTVAVILLSLIAWIFSQWMDSYSKSRAIYKFIGGTMIGYSIVMLLV